jgi:hypothetical protein
MSKYCSSKWKKLEKQRTSRERLGKTRMDK